MGISSLIHVIGACAQASFSNRKCTIIETSVPLDTNLEFNYKNKQEKYVPLVWQLQQLHWRHRYSVIVITVGVLGAVPKNLEENLQCLGMQRDKIQTIIKDSREQPS